MDQQTSAPKISILNLRDAETLITYPLLLVHGTIEDSTNSKELTEMIVTLNSCEQQSQIRSEIKDNQFKALIELRLGRNEIVLRAGNSLKTLQIIYEPRTTEYVIVPLYVICKEDCGKFQAPSHEDDSPESASKRIDTACKILQCFVAEKLNELDLGRKTFQTIPCDVFRTHLTHQRARAMTQQQIWEYLGREIMNSPLGNERRKYVAFLSFTRYHGDLYRNQIAYDDLLRITSCYVALGGGGLAVFGTACLYTWPETCADVCARFKNRTPVNRREFLDDSCYRGTECGCFSTTLGSVLHELCHAFDLGHTKVGIMGRGFDSIERTFVEPTSYARANGVTLKTGVSSIRKHDFTAVEVLEKPVKSDEVYFTKSSAAFLSYHRWFNDCKAKRTPKDAIKYDDDLKLIRSINGIRVVELRAIEDESVLCNWMFTGKILKYTFLIPQETVLFHNNNDSHSLLIVVIDNMGIILKENVSTNKSGLKCE